MAGGRGSKETPGPNVRVLETKGSLAERASQALRMKWKASWRSDPRAIDLHFPHRQKLKLPSLVKSCDGLQGRQRRRLRAQSRHRAPARIGIRMKRDPRRRARQQQSQPANAREGPAYKIQNKWIERHPQRAHLFPSEVPRPPRSMWIRPTIGCVRSAALCRVLPSGCV